MTDQIFVGIVIIGMLFWLLSTALVGNDPDIPRALRVYVIPGVLFPIYVVLIPLAINWWVL